MELRLVELKPPVPVEDGAFVAECLVDLYAPIAGRAAELRAYLDDNLDPARTSVFLVEADGERAGVVTLVRFAMPRYLGFGYEIQELVVAQHFRGRGIAKRVLERVAEHCRLDPHARKVIIRTNVEGAMRAYASVWSETDLVSYQTMLHLLQEE